MVEPWLATRSRSRADSRIFFYEPTDRDWVDIRRPLAEATGRSGLCRSVAGGRPSVDRPSGWLEDGGLLAYYGNGVAGVGHLHCTSYGSSTFVTQSTWSNLKVRASGSRIERRAAIFELKRISSQHSVGLGSEMFCFHRTAVILQGDRKCDSASGSWRNADVHHQQFGQLQSKSCYPFIVIVELLPVTAFYFRCLSLLLPFLWRGNNKSGSSGGPRALL